MEKSINKALFNQTLKVLALRVPSKLTATVINDLKK